MLHTIWWSQTAGDSAIDSVEAETKYSKYWKYVLLSIPCGSLPCPFSKKCYVACCQRLAFSAASWTCPLVARIPMNSLAILATISHCVARTLQIMFGVLQTHDAPRAGFLALVLFSEGLSNPIFARNGIIVFLKLLGSSTVGIKAQCCFCSIWQRRCQNGSSEVLNVFWMHSRIECLSCSLMPPVFVLQNNSWQVRNNILGCNTVSFCKSQLQ